jgi:hypothetical protein
MTSRRRPPGTRESRPPTPQPQRTPGERACSSCSRRGEHASWCPSRELDWDPKPPMSDAEVIELLGPGTRRDDRGYWQRPSRPAPTRAARRRAVVARRCLTCGIDRHESEHLDWCDDAPPHDTVGAALRDARDLEAAIAWQPKVDLPKLTPPERDQLNKLYDALLARNREGAA